MIQQQTILKVADNSGAKTVKCIKVIGNFKKRYATLGDIIIVSVQELRNKSKTTSKIQRKEVHKALVIRIKKKKKKKDGSFSWLNKGKSSVVLVDKKGNPIGTRITEPLSSILRKKKFSKFISISPGIII